MGIRPSATTWEQWRSCKTQSTVGKSVTMLALADHDYGNPWTTLFLHLVDPMRELAVGLRVKREDVPVRLGELEFTAGGCMPEGEGAARAEGGTRGDVEDAAPPETSVVALMVMVERQAHTALLVDVDPPGQQLSVDALREAAQHVREGGQLLAAQILNDLSVEEPT